MNNLVAFIAFIMLYNHHLYLVLKYVCQPKMRPLPVKQYLLFFSPHFQSLGTIYLCSVSMDLPTLIICHIKWNHKICEFFFVFGCSAVLGSHSIPNEVAFRYGKYSLGVPVLLRNNWVCQSCRVNIIILSLLPGFPDANSFLLDLFWDYQRGNMCTCAALYHWRWELKALSQWEKDQ